MKVKELGITRVAGAGNLDIIIHVPGAGRVITYDVAREIARVHVSPFDQQVIDYLNATSFASPANADYMMSISKPNNAKYANRVIASYSISNRNMLLKAKQMSMEIVGYERIDFTKSRIIRTYIDERVTPRWPNLDHLRDDAHESQRKQQEGISDKGDRVSDYFLMADVANGGDIVSIGVGAESGRKILSLNGSILEYMGYSDERSSHSVQALNIGSVLNYHANLTIENYRQYTLDYGQAEKAKSAIWNYYVNNGISSKKPNLAEGSHFYYSHTTIEER